MSGVYQSIEKYSIEEFVEICKTLPTISVRKQNWLNLIEAGRLTCPISGLKVAYCSFDRANNGGLHYNLYSECKHLMTIDHIIPKVKGGNNDISNIQPMVTYFNSYKSDKLVSNEELKVMIIRSRKKFKVNVVDALFY